MDNRALLAIILSVIILIGYQFLVPQPQQPPAPPQQVPEKQAETVKADAPPVVPAAVSSEEKEVRVETDMYEAVLSSLGGTIKSWKLKNYKGKDGADVLLLEKRGSIPALGSGPDDSFALASANFSVAGRDLRLDSSTKTGTVVFEYAREGVSVRRTYTFHAGLYKVDITDEVSGIPAYWVTLGADFGIFDRKETYTHVGPTALIGTDLKNLTFGDLKEPQTFAADLKWIAQEDKYFFSALVPVSSPAEAKAWTANTTQLIALKTKPGTNTFTLYAGPKERDRLAELNIGLEHIIDFGFFSIIARPLFWILLFFHSFIGNYGWAIVLLTIVTRIPFIPLLNKGQRSMKKLQEIQPKIAEIRDKYKKDPQKMQKEMAEIYKKYKVNPVSGCLPMLLQIPVFIALYNVLQIAIELRGAPFISWITDLSAPDTLFGHIPSYIPLIGDFALGPLPIVMGLTMVIQQKMTPTSADPTQAKIMMVLPVIFTFMFLNFASGLVLYWLINNILSIIQQFFVNRKTEKKTE